MYGKDLSPGGYKMAPNSNEVKIHTFHTYIQAKRVLRLLSQQPTKALKFTLIRH